MNIIIKNIQHNVIAHNYNKNPSGPYIYIYIYIYILCPAVMPGG